MDDPILDTANKFAKAYNSWATKVKNLSPFSPDYKDRAREIWERQGLSTSFWVLEERVRSK